jgi:hypothetical protein
VSRRYASFQGVLFPVQRLRHAQAETTEGLKLKFAGNGLARPVRLPIAPRENTRASQRSLAHYASARLYGIAPLRCLPAIKLKNYTIVKNRGVLQASPGVGRTFVWYVLTYYLHCCGRRAVVE